MGSAGFLFTFALAVVIASFVVEKGTANWFDQYKEACKKYTSGDCKDPLGEYICLDDALNLAFKNGTSQEDLKDEINYVIERWNNNTMEQGPPCLTSVMVEKGTANWFDQRKEACKKYTSGDCKDPLGEYICLKNALKLAHEKGTSQEDLKDEIKYVVERRANNTMEQGLPCLTAGAKDENERKKLQKMSDRCYANTKGICKYYALQIRCLKSWVTSPEGGLSSDMQRAIGVTEILKLKNPPCKRFADGKTCYAERFHQLFLKLSKGWKEGCTTGLLKSATMEMKELAEDCPLQAKDTKPYIDNNVHMYNINCVKG